MVFNSYSFILLFLPATFLIFAIVQRAAGWQSAFAVLGIASLVYYGNWSLELLAILIASVMSNYVVGRILVRSTRAGRPQGWLMVVGVVANLIGLGYVKYTNFFIDTINQAADLDITHIDLLLPIGISFYTFIQIGYLIEAHGGRAEEQPFLRYLTFATFFPCVTAGPLVLQREIFDQMDNREDSVLDFPRLAGGIALFSIGLFKKVVIADAIAPYANTAFDGIAAGGTIEIVTAWAGALAYSLQLYFDFSGYTDMALGLGAIFGLMLPLNFNSPFKATSISDFWQRWHMTMTRFFTTFVYSPMAMRGMRKAVARQRGPFARFVSATAWPIVVTMLVAGIWHGAGWTFAVYGLIHGIAIAINNGWKHFAMPKLPAPLGWALTMAVVVSGLVIFRADTLTTAGVMLASMWGLSGFLLDAGGAPVAVVLEDAAMWIALLGALVLLAPNSQEILSRNWLSTTPRPEAFARMASLFAWRPAFGWSVVTAACFLAAFVSIGSESSFLYYKF